MTSVSGLLVCCAAGGVACCVVGFAGLLLAVRLAVGCFAGQMSA